MPGPIVTPRSYPDRGADLLGAERANSVNTAAHVVFPTHRATPQGGLRIVNTPPAVLWAIFVANGYSGRLGEIRAGQIAHALHPRHTLKPPKHRHGGRGCGSPGPGPGPSL